MTHHPGCGVTPASPYNVKLALALALVLCLGAAYSRGQSSFSENFDDWTASTNWETRVHSSGWGIVEAQIRPSRGWSLPFSMPHAAYLRGTNATGWVQSPWLANGADTLTFWTKRHPAGSGAGLLQIEFSPDLTNWLPVATLAVTNDAWLAQTNVLGIYQPGALRFMQREASSATLSVGLDDLAIFPVPLGVSIDPLRTAARQLAPCTRRSPLTISEVMYHPPSRGDGLNLEFVEIFNTEPVAHDLSNFRLSGDVDFRFPTNFTLAARAFVVVARDPAAVQSVYAITNVLGPFTNALPNDFGTVRLHNEQDAILIDLAYGDDAPWPAAADGAGHSLWLRQPDHGEQDVRAWSASARVGGSPGTADPVYVDRLDGLVINEFLAHTDLPAVDFIELHNTTDQPLAIGGCSLSDSVDIDTYTFPAGTILPPGGFVVRTPAELGFALSSHGDAIILRNPSKTRVLDAVRFGAQANGSASGRSPDGAPAFRVLSQPTPGTTNALRHTADVAINEIMYAPISGSDADEYIELFNRGTAAVDLGNWRFVAGVDFAIAPGTVLAPGAYLVIARDVTNLLARYPQLSAANTVGDYRGALSDRGERVALARPDNPALPYEDFVVVDEVTYADGWGAWADGGGSSLELIDPRSDNGLGPNWAASDETQKAPWTSVVHTGRVDNGLGAITELQIIGLQSGEFLLDDVELVRDGDTLNRIANPGFESGLAGWQLRGNHVRSALRTTEGFGSAKSLHVRATDRGDITFTGSTWTFYNQVAAYPSPAPAANERFALRAKVRWLCGYPQMLLSLQGFWLEAAGRMELPADLGTPGLPNSRAVANAPPAISAVSHSPLLPAATQPVRVSARLHDADGIAAAWLSYRLDPSTNLVTLPMAHAGSGLYTTTIPGQTIGTLVAFTIGATDANAAPASGAFPQAAGRECLVRFGDMASSGVFGGYRLWLTAANQALWNSRLTHDNEPIDLTFVVDGARAIYNGGGHYRGGWRTNNGPAGSRMCAYNLEVPKLERVLGDNEIKLDMTGFDSDDGTRQGERFSFWMARQLGHPYANLRLVNVWVNGVLRQPLHEYQVPSQDFVQSWYPGEADPPIFKQETQDALTLMVTDGGEYKQARYRDIWRPRKPRHPSDDLQDVYARVAAFNLPYGDAYRARTGALADLDSWIGYFGVNHVLENIDSWGYDLHHNAFLYLSRIRPGPAFLQDTDFAMYPRYTSAAHHDPFFNDDPVTARLFNYPPFRRAYWRLLKEAVNGPMLPERYNPVFDELDAAMTANGMAHTSPVTLKAWLANRRAYLLPMFATVEAAFAITSNAGADFTTNAPRTVLAGTAPVEVAEIRINGASYAFDFPSVTDWTTTVPLQPGGNVLTVEGFDRFGRLIATDAITVTATVPPPDPAGWIVISEIMYHAPVEHADYLEIFNRSSNDTFNLSGARINGVGFTFPPGTFIRPRESRVIAENLTTYTLIYTNAEAVIGAYEGELDNGGEALVLQRPGAASNTWIELDRVHYDDAPPWPAEAAGLGRSLQLIDPDQDNNRPGNWRVAIPAPAPAWQVHYTPGTTNNVAAVLPPFPRLWIAELMASNRTATVDNRGDHDPWVELFNAETNALELGDYFLSNDNADLTRWVFPTGVVIGAEERLLVWLDGESDESAPDAPHTSFAIDSVSGSLALARALPDRIVLIDHMAYGPLAPDTSYGAYPDGDPHSRQVFHYPSPGQPNAPVAQPMSVTVNEWLADNTRTLADPADGRFQDWFELYNGGDVRVHLGGYRLADRMDAADGFVIPGGTWIEARGFLLLWADGQTGQNQPGRDLHVNFSLSKDGEALALYAPDGTLVDGLTFGEQATDLTQGRWPDGVGGLRPLWPPTPAASNAALVIREVSRNADGFMLAWPARPGATYRVEQCAVLTAGTWQAAAIVTATVTEATYGDTNAAAGPLRFYRITELP